jgi:hypothetical protein
MIAIVGSLQSGIGAILEAGDTLAQDTVVMVRGRPLRAIGLATIAGAVVGLVVGYGLGWFARGRRRNGGTR